MHVEKFEPRDGYKKYQVDGFFLCWFHYDRKLPEQTVYGFSKLNQPSVGDVLTCLMESGRTSMWIFTSVEPKWDPPDMYFATVVPYKYEDE
jgi:hypothetical protein